MTLELITLNGQQYYSADDLKLIYKPYFLGTSRTTRLIIGKKNISPTNYIYAIKSAKNGWIQSEESSKRAKVLLKQEFCQQSIISPPTTPKKIKKDIPIVKPPSPIISRTTEEPENAPPILYLDEEEMFKDADGNVLPIEVRGERNRQNIFFRVKDISDNFVFPKLKTVLLNNSSEYKRGLHFKTFIRQSTVVNYDPNLPNKKTSLFLTYKGLLRFLFVSRNKNAEQFQDWAEEKLFTIQMGTQEEKDKLGTKIQNINYSDFSNVFRKHANKLSAIYLIKIGQVKDIRTTFNIPDSYSDEQMLYKYGFTDDLNRRFKEHCKNIW